jgi:hypothetical protein
MGRWKNKSNAPAPQSNIMVYEPYGNGGMKVTIEQVDKNGKESKWGYNTDLKGGEAPLYGNEGVDTGAVRVVNDRINEITYKKNGKVVQILTNVLSPDHSTLGIIYLRQDPETGVTKNVTFATYEKIQ